MKSRLFIGYLTNFQPWSITDSSKKTLHPIIFRNICKTLWTPNINLFASRISHQEPIYTSQKPDHSAKKKMPSKSLGWRAMSFPFLFHRKGFQKGLNRDGHFNSNNSSLAKSSLVPKIINMVLITIFKINFNDCRTVSRPDNSPTDTSPKTNLRLTLPRRIFPQTDNSPTGHFPEGHFPDWTFPH